MTRTTTGFCIAAALGFAVSVGAQSTTSDQRYNTSDKDKTGHEITVTGCLSKGADGNYMLTNAHVDTPNNTASSGTTTSGATGTTAGTTATGTSGTTSGTAGTTAGAPTTSTYPSNAGSSSSSMATTWMLTGGNDLDKHVGHKIQVTGRATGDMSNHPRKDEDAAAAGTTAAGATTTTGSTAGTTGTTGTTSSIDQQRSRDKDSDAHAGHQMLSVTSVKMISSSCQ